MAGRVITDPVREHRAHVHHAQYVDEEFRQLIDARARVDAEYPELVPDHARTGGRRRDDSVIAREVPGEFPRQPGGGLPVAAVEMHLAAAGLPGRETHLAVKPAQQRDDRPAGLRIQGVTQARDKQGHPHAAHAPSAARSSHSAAGISRSRSAIASLISAALRAPISTLATAGCRSGNRAAAARSGTPYRPQAASSSRARLTSAAGAG